MRNEATVQRPAEGTGRRLPRQAYRDAGGREVRLRDFRGRRSVFLLDAPAGDERALAAARSLADAVDELRYWRAEAVVHGDLPEGMPLLQVSGEAPPGEARLLIGDRWGEVVADYRDELPGRDELVEWAKFLEISCGACATPD